MDIPNDDLVHFLEREEDFFPGSIIGGGFCNDDSSKKYYDINEGPGLIFHNHNILSIKSRTKKFVDNVRIKIQDIDYIDEVLKKVLKAADNFLNYAKNLDEKESLQKILLEFYKKAKKYC